MRVSRPTIARAMVLIVFIALDLAAFRVAFLTEDPPEIFGANTTPFEMMLMFGLPCLLAELGLFRAIFDSPRHRPFWISLAAVTVAIVSVLGWAVLAGLPLISELWMSYYGGFDRFAARFAGFSRNQDRFVVGDLTIGGILLSLYLFVPQLIVAAISSGVASAALRYRAARQA